MCSIGYGVVLMSGGITEKRNTASTSFELTGLVAKSVYTVKVTAINNLTKESSITRSQGVSFETLAATVPSEPWGLASFSSTGGSIEVSWNVPLKSGGVSLSAVMYNVTMFPIKPCYQQDAADPCALCGFGKLQGNEQYQQIVAAADRCEKPSTSGCPDGTSSCCLTRESSGFGAGLQCGHVVGQGRHRLVVGSNTTVFQGLNHSTTYYFGVQASNLVGSSAFSTIAGLGTV